MRDAGGHPEDMSASAHEQRAAEEERIAATLGPGKDRDQMKFRQKLADDHRRAARALRDAEEKACAGLGTTERALEPFAPARIVTVERIDGSGQRLRGALVRLRPVENETVDALKRRIECAEARNAVLGADRPEARRSPFAIPGVNVLVRTLPEGPIVELQTEDQSRAKRLAERLRRYVARE